MRRIYLNVIALALLAVGISGYTPVDSVSAQQDRQISISDLEAFTDGIAADRMDDLDPTAMMVTVVRGDDQFAKAYGVADLESGRRADETTLFRVGSISKTFTWLSVMMLVEEGKLDLNADVNKYLTQFKIPDAFGKPVTLKDIMAHRTGFETTLQIFFDPRRDASLAEALQNTMPTRVAAPGERISYSNWASGLAALIVQNQSGVSYDQYIERQILTPLGMKSTTLYNPAQGVMKPQNPASLDARMAHPMRIKNGSPEQKPYTILSSFYPVGAAAMDARDAAIYMRMLLNETRYDGGRLLSEQSWTKMQGMAFSDSKGADDMSYGFQRKTIAGLPAFGHAGATSFLANMILIPELNMGVMVAQNSTTNYSEVRAFASLIARRATGMDFDPVMSVKSGSLKDAQQLAGTYIVNRRSFTGAEKFTQLGADRTVIANADGSITINFGPTDVRLIPSGDDVWTAASGARIKALRDKSGQVFRLAMGTDTMDRAGFFERSSSFNLLVGLSLLLSITTLLGAWWRFKRDVPTNATGQRLRFVPIISAIVWIVFAATLFWLTRTVADFDGPAFASEEVEYPPLSAVVALAVAMTAAIMTVIQIIAVVPVWLKSGWTIWRRGHFTIFAVVTSLAVFVMWNWNMIGKPLYDMG